MMTKCQFYSSFNTVYLKLKCRLPDVHVTSHLLGSVAAPIPLYAIEVLNLNSTHMKSLEYTYCKVLYKV